MRSLTVPKLGVNSQQAADLSAEPAQHWVNATGSGCATCPAQPSPGRRSPPRNTHPVPADCQGDCHGPEWARTDGGIPQPRPGHPSAHPVGPVNTCACQRGRWASTPFATTSSTLQPSPPILSTRLTHAPSPHHASYPQAQLQRLPQHRLGHQLRNKLPVPDKIRTLTLNKHMLEHKLAYFE